MGSRIGRTWSLPLLAAVATCTVAARLPDDETWLQLPGAAHDVGVGGDGSVWVVGTNPTPGGFGIWRLRGGSWSPRRGGAVRIDADPMGKPWVVNSDGGIFRGDGVGWSQMPGTAKDIGVGADGSVWVIGTNPTPGGFGVHRWTGSTWQAVDGGGVRIDVDPRGNPWLVDDAGGIFRRVGDAWVRLPGAATDVGIGADGTVWITGTESVGGGHRIYRGSGADWRAVDGGAVQVSVGPTGAPWVVNSEHGIFARE